jgi:hypothetical protein
LVVLWRPCTNSAIQLSNVVVSRRFSSIIRGGGGTIVVFRSMRGTVVSRNGKGTRSSGRLYGSDHSACIGFNHCGTKELCFKVLFCCTFFLCAMSCVYIVLVYITVR